MSKFDRLTELSSLDTFTARDAIDAFDSDQDSTRIGTRALTNIKEIDLDRITVKDQVRTTYDQTKHEELVAMLREQGQLQPIVVYWDNDAEGGQGRYVVFMGHRRFRAAPEAGLSALQAVVLSEPPTEADRIEKQAAENLAREDLNPIDEGRGYADIQRLTGASARDMAKRFGKDQTYISRAMKWLTLPENIQQAIAAGDLPKSVATELTKLDREPAQQEAFEAHRSGAATYGTIAQSVKKKPSKSAAKKPHKKELTKHDLKFVVTAKKKFTKHDLVAAMQELIEDLENDGRGKKPGVAGHVAA